MSDQRPITCIKESFLISRAAELHNLIIQREPREDCRYPVFDTEPVGTFELNDDDFMAVLERLSFTFGPGTTHPHNKMVYLAGNSDQRGAEIYESDCWAWDREETNPKLNIHFYLGVNESERGIMCTPHVWGNCRGGACHRPTIYKFVKAIAEHFSDLHVLIMMAANIETSPVIHWNEIGFGGVKSVDLLFDELFGKNKNVMELARSRLSPFDPNPDSWGGISEVIDRLFVSEADQPKLFRQWKEQLQTLKASLV